MRDEFLDKKMNVQQLETSLRKLLERQTQEVEIASDARERGGRGRRNRRVTKPPEKENSKHPSTLEVLSEELPMKFKYPVDKEPYDGTSDHKHYLDTFNNRMVLLNASDAVKYKAVTITLKKDAQKSEWSKSFLKLHHSEKAHKDTRVG
ncbi:hypothetical protein PIB30_018721 [Stylosanthes scabra]|uniref:Uncharacterized protein n=1 Tax=Stylosanthes scabra TaxID=79078 RepID=A0ABU6Y6K7_9FABA|nr:hypothetical protein [Stylosanthes scabra]